MIEFSLGLILYFIIIGLLVVNVNRAILLPYIVFFLLSFFLGIIQAYILDLPQGGSDARGFFREASFLSETQFEIFIDLYPGPSSYFISWFHGLVFTITAPSVLMANAFSTLFTLIAIIACVKIAREAWGDWAQVKVAWFVCLFPTTLLHSAIMLREAYVTAFFAIGILFVLRWRRTMLVRYFLLAQLAFTGAIFFHGAMVVASLALLLYAAFMATRVMLVKLSRDRNFLPYAFILVGVLGIILVLPLAGIRLPKVGDLASFFDADLAAEHVLQRGGAATARGGAAHPSWTLINNPVELLPKLPIRFVYFVFSPFPWDIRSPAHLIGLLDASLYILMFFALYKYRHEIKRRPEIFAIVVITIICVASFSLGVTNFGTSIRHRAKFVIPLVAIAAPLLPRIRFSSRRNALRP